MVTEALRVDEEGVAARDEESEEGKARRGRGSILLTRERSVGGRIQRGNQTWR